MIAWLPSSVFYISTRKLVGAFYVDQKKKGLLPSTLPSEHEQWGTAASSQWAGVLTFTYPIALKNRVLYAVAQEENPYAWRENQSVSISSAFYSQSLTSCQVITKTVVNGGNVLDQDSSTKVLIIGY